MMPSVPSSPRPLNNALHWLTVVFVIIAAIGLADAVYLTVEHVRGVVPPCTLVSGCEQVLTSRYAAVAFVPVPFLGVVFYFSILVLSFFTLESRTTIALPWLFRLTMIGFVGTLWFLFVQVVLLHAFCLYCLVSATTSTMLFLLSLYGRRFLRTIDI